MYQFMFLQVLRVGILIYDPSIVTWLPTMLQEQASTQRIPADYYEAIGRDAKDASACNARGTAWLRVISTAPSPQPSGPT